MSLLQLFRPGNVSSSLGLDTKGKSVRPAAQKVSFDKNSSLSQKVALAIIKVFLNSSTAQSSKKLMSFMKMRQAMSTHP